MPLISLAVVAYASGLLAGFASLAWVALPASACVALVAAWRAGWSVCGLALAFAAGVGVAADAPPPTPWRTRTSAPAGVLDRWRARTGAAIDSLYGERAPVVRALLIADTRQLPRDLRDRYAAAGLVHVLSISGLHVAIIAGAVLLGLQAARLPRAPARWLAALVTAAYVVAIGAPPPALRSGTMLAAQTLGWALQRPVSPWATLALGALVPLLVDPRTVLDLGWQLSVAGFASVVAAGVCIKRDFPARLRGWRRRAAADVLVSTMAAFASAPLVAWHFGRVSLVAPASNLVAAPVVAVMQPALFLSLALAPIRPLARIVADGAGVLVGLLDVIATLASRLPGAAPVIAPSLSAALLAGVASTCVVAAAAARRDRMRWAVGAAASAAACAWWALIPAPRGGLEVHLVDVGQGDAIAIRSPRGRWLVVDAGGGRTSGDAGRRVLVPYLRRRGGDVALFVMTHPHDDHVGGAPALIDQLRPDDVRDAAFAGTSPAYREALVAARDAGVPWHRIHPGDSLDVDGVVATFLAPDSAWTAALSDPNLASAVVRIRFGAFRALLTGDAEAPEEAWLLARDPAALRADVLKVAHHGSATSTTPAWLDAVSPSVALVSVGAGNRYHHPSPGVVAALAAHHASVVRTDLLGSIVVRTDRTGEAYTVEARGTTIYRGRARSPVAP